MGPRCVCISTRTASSVADTVCALKGQSSASAIPTFTRRPPTKCLKSRSSRAFVQDFPLRAVADPVLALLHLVGEIAARVVLREIDHREIVAPRVEHDGNVAERYLDPLLPGVDAPLLCRPVGQPHALPAEIARVVGQITIRVPAFPVGAPALQPIGKAPLQSMC